jgi:uncharacterized protein
VILFAATGLLTQEGMLACVGLLVPAMLIGFYAGNRLHSVIPAASVVRAVYAVLVIAGTSLVVRGVA